MDKLSNEEKEDAEYSEERKKLFKNLMKINFQKDIIQCKLTNIMSIDEKTNEAQKDDVNMNKSGKWEMSQSISLRYPVIENHHLPPLHMANKIAINEKY